MPIEAQRGPEGALVASGPISPDLIIQVIQFLIRFGDSPICQKIAIEGQRGPREAQRALEASCLHLSPNEEHTLYCTVVA